MRITSKGQVTIPKHVREKLGVKPGDDIGFREEGGQMIVYNDGPAADRAKGESFAERLAAYGAKLQKEGLLEPLGMSVDEYMDLIRGYDEDADDPGFQRRP